MRIVRSDDEQIVSAHGRYLYGQSNNLYYNQQNNTSCAYDAEVEFSYSDKLFINELAKDRAYGTANIKPLAKDLNSFTERMYKDAVEEASRVKTMGYFNQFPELKLSNPVQNSPHNIRNQIKNNNINNNRAKGGHIANMKSPNNVIQSNTPKESSNIINFDVKAHAPINSEPIKKQDNNFFNFGSEPIKEMRPPEVASPPNKYNDLLDQVHNNLKQEIATQIVEENRLKLREQVKVEANNIPYRKTKEFVPTENTSPKPEPQQKLQVRNSKEKKSTKEKNGGLIFARVCLGLFMIVSLIAVYLYCTGKLNLDVITKYLNL